MTGPATYADDRDAAAQARAALDAVEASVRTVDAAQRATLARLIRLWPTAAWLVAGAKTARTWLVAHAGMAPTEARRLERIAQLCSTHPALAEAVVSGTFRLAWADRLARSVTPERGPFFEGAVQAFLELAIAKSSDDDFDTALRYWTARVDEHLEPRTVPKHAVLLSRRLFGGGQAQAGPRIRTPKTPPTSARSPNDGPTASSTSATSPTPTIQSTTTTATPTRPCLARTRKISPTTPSTALRVVTTSTSNRITPTSTSSNDCVSESGAPRPGSGAEHGGGSGAAPG